MHSLHHITHSLEGEPLLSDISLHLKPGRVMALIGKNGSGKTTLLRIGAGEILPDHGQVRREGERVGYLPQELIADENETMATLLSSAPPGSVRASLAKVGLEGADMGQKVRTLSGGQRTRLGLARLLLGHPTVLILDEPTNNLDSEGLDWLCSFLTGFPGAILVTSHDRAFLDAVATETAELSEGRLTVYGGNYTFARAQQEAERRSLRARFESQESYRKRLLADIQNTKSQAKGVELTTTQVNTRRYAKKVARKAIVREARLERQMESDEWLEKPFEHDGLYFPLPETLVPASKIVLRVEGLQKSYGGKAVIRDLHFQMVGNRRVFLRGPNGSGKSTLLSLILGAIPPDGGTIHVGHGIRVGHLSQEGFSSHGIETGKDRLERSGIRRTKWMRCAGALGLTPRMLGCSIGKLSRGQQTKLALIEVLLASPQLLILDEPTNHLELETREATESALRQFEGAILVASHDRYFVQSLSIDETIELS